MLKYLVFLFLAGPALAGGLHPAVNADSGCSVAGQVLSFDGSNIICGAPIRPNSTVAALGTCAAGNQGQMKFVTDALAPVALATVAAGGAVKIGVTCNGTNWIVQ